MASNIDPDISKIAQGWVEKWSRLHNAEQDDSLSENELDFILPSTNPMLCIAVIEHVLTLIPAEPSNKLFQVLAAGPLEDVLKKNGDVVIERVEVLARRSAEFCKLLNGVWLSGAKPEIQARLQKYVGAGW